MNTFNAQQNRQGWPLPFAPNTFLTLIPSRCALHEVAHAKKAMRDACTTHFCTSFPRTRRDCVAFTNESLMLIELGAERWCLFRCLPLGRTVDQFQRNRAKLPFFPRSDSFLLRVSMLSGTLLYNAMCAFLKAKHDSQSVREAPVLKVY